jgi:hypothetical protein
MLQMTNANSGAGGRLLLRASLVLIGVAIGLAISGLTFAQEAGQKTFNSPAEAGDALAAAAAKHDDQALLAIWGSSAHDLVSSGDAVEDQRSNDRFAEKYREMHRFVATGEGRTFLYVGSENWPTPIPLQKGATGWYFDSSFGRQEVLYRRIGSNELNVIQVCHAVVDAEQDYYGAPHDGGSGHQYSAKFRSTAGKQDGLYWEVKSGEPESPLGPLVAQASAEGYEHHEHDAGQPHPFQGYVYRLLTRQGVDAAGGARNYVVDGKMTDGFALVAYPVNYRVTGVMTFVVNQEGQIYQKDLGPQTQRIAAKMTVYNPDKTWTPAEDETGAAGDQ